MLTCSSCYSQDTLSAAQICTSCSRIFCASHKLTTCPFCKKSLEELTVSVEKKNGFNLQWLDFKNSHNLAVATIDRLPSYTFRILEKMAKPNSKLKVIIFQSKADSVSFEKELAKTNGFTPKEKIISEQSRYSVFLYGENDEGVILLNSRAITSDSALFLVTILPRVYLHMRKLREKMGFDEKLALSIGEVFFSYNKKMGIPFVDFDEPSETFVQFLTNNIQQAYGESSVIIDLINNQEFTNEISDFLEYKIKMNLSTMDFESRFFLPEVFQTLEKILLITITYASVTSNKEISQSIHNSLKNDFEKLFNNYQEMPDVIRAIELILQSEKEITFGSYKEYIDSVCKILKDSFHEIEARYVSLGECLKLFEISKCYLRDLENGIYTIVPNFGSLDDFLRLIEKVFDQEGIYPEIRIITGMALHDTLLERYLLTHSFSDYVRLVDSTKRFCQLFEVSFSEIKRKNGSINGIGGSPLSYEDPATAALSIAKIAETVNDPKSALALTTIAYDFANKYNLSSIKADILWSNLVKTQDFSCLFQIHEEINKIDFIRFPYRKSLNGAIDLLVQALLFGNAEEKIDQAMACVLEAVDPVGETEVFVNHSIENYQAFSHLLEIFRGILTFENKFEMLEKAYSNSLALGRVIPAQDPLNVFGIKTKILFKLLTGNHIDACQLCKELSSFCSHENNLFYISLVKKWVEISKTEPHRRYIYEREFNYEGNDPWIKVLLRAFRQEMQRDFAENITSAKALVFVEGEIDFLVFQAFSNLLAPKDKIAFMNIEGWANHDFYIEARMTKGLKMPCYVIFDGDTAEMRKKDLTKELMKLSITENHIHTLSYNSIENYLLNARAINQAFPFLTHNEVEIQKFFDSHNQRKNKKNVLKALFQESQIKYNKSVAEKIAQSISMNEINPELIQLITNIANLRSVNS